VLAQHRNLLGGRLLVARALLVHQVLQGHRVQVVDHPLVEGRPQLVRHARAVVLAILLAAALGGVQWLVDRENDVRDADLARRARKRIAAAGATGALDQLMTAQLAEQLLEIRQRNLLALADACQGDRPVVLAQGQIDHRRNRETTLSCQTHD
jgi:hypothetical protein